MSSEKGRVQSVAGDVEASTVYRVADWLGRHGYHEACDAILGLISGYEPTCDKPCCTERKEYDAAGVPRPGEAPRGELHRRSGGCLWAANSEVTVAPGSPTACRNGSTTTASASATERAHPPGP